MADEHDLPPKRSRGDGSQLSKSNSDRKRKRTDEEESCRKNRGTRFGRDSKATIEKSNSRRSGKQADDRQTLDRLGKEKADAVVFSSDGSKLYVVDRKGDRQNLIYGSLGRYSIPLYRRSGNGGVLGVQASHRIDRDVSDDKALIVQDRFASKREGKSRLHTQRHSDRGVRRILPKDSKEAEDHDADFVGLKPGKQSLRKGGSHIQPFSLFDQGHGDLSSDEADDKAEDSGPEVDEALNDAKSKQAELSKRTTSDPTDLQAWLDLIAHQEVMVRMGATTDKRAMSGAERRGLADVRLSIYERALKVVQSLPDQVKLVLGLLREGSNIWDSKQLAVKWKDYIDRYPKSPDLRIRYIDFIQSNIAIFSYEKCLEAYRKPLQAVDSTKEDKLRILIRLTRFMKDSGYHELAIGIWQALLEYHTFHCGIFNRSLDDIQEFWGSEVSRIGEQGARGWRHYSSPSHPSGSRLSSGTAMDVPEAVRFEDQFHPTADSCFQQFGVLESCRMKHLFLPGRAADDVGEDDPFHMIMTNDVLDYWDFLQGEVEPIAVVSAVLGFGGLPPLPSGLIKWHGDAKQRADQFLRFETLCPPKQSPESGSFRDNLERLSRLPMKCRMLTTEHLFSDAFDANQSGPLIDWVRRVLELISFAPEKEMGKEHVIQEYFVALEWHFSPSTAMKTAKRLLKKHPSNLRLYNAIALMESRSGKTEESDRIFMAALDLALKLDQSDQEPKILLLRTWVWEALRLGDVKKAATRLMTFGSSEVSTTGPGEASGNVFTPAAVLRVRRMLADGIDHATSLGDEYLVALYGECLAILEYLRYDRDFQSADLSFSHSITKSAPLTKHLMANELLHQARAQLLASHAIFVKTFKPSALRDAILTSVNLFPSNTDFLTLFAANESKFRMDQRVRALLKTDESGDEEHAFIRSVFAIWTEMNRGVELGGTKHAIRSAFENALRNDAGKHSFALWRSYVQYEMELADFERAKKVFFRGVTHLPWSKDFMMLAFTELVDHLTFRELKRVYGVLEEKELRIMVNIQEQVDEREEMEETKLDPVGFAGDSSGEEA
ncbi:DUF1740-domain-containing protein [Eremomyces bilateralis CBS 781.70]|uniref:DUF1740-domain-containing protein n=1 Tax=Eremomyces bilateralis CBS 781.70 TaxID=1392243 RepID=A0A6G1G190_9PEZI|nr:DUF1740-domain-containing protein [Eremomyces bilateralis CBS 781.70]KAF1811803.1 DUF1740-domain-containing protein [Eremomyces bilateralis CBS 781.70]